MRRGAIAVGGIAAGILVGLGAAWLLWRPGPSGRDPVSQLTALLLDFELKPLPRPSGEIEPGAILTADLSYFAARTDAWTSPNTIQPTAKSIIRSATYKDVIDASANFRATLPGLGSAKSAAASLGLTGARMVETEVENVEVLEVPELTLAPEAMTTRVKDLLPRGLIVVRATCRIGKLKYRFLDRDGKTLAASLDAAKAVVGGEVATVGTSEGSILLENVCIAIGPCTLLYQAPTFRNAAVQQDFRATLKSAGIPEPDASGLVKVETDPFLALAAVRALEGTRVVMEVEDLRASNPNRVDLPQWNRIRSDFDRALLRPKGVKPP